MTAPDERHCARCGRTGPLMRSHCGSCYQQAYHRGEHIDLPRVNRRRADVVDDYLELRDQGYNRAQIAGRLRMSRNALDQALKRAARAGDTRIDYQPRAVAA